MKVTTALATLVLAVGGLTSATGSSAYAIETCFGMTPTIVTTPGEGEFMGTEGDDVIVDNHGRWISALGGNDAICSVGSGSVDAGDGDDQVTVLDAEKGNLTFLGLGSDVYIGSDADERVSTGTYDATDMLGGVEGDVDTVSTFGGDDRVHSLAFGYANADTVDLGDGDDSARIISGEGASFAVAGGEGDDVVDFELFRVNADTTIDLEAGTVEIGAPAGALLPGFENASASDSRGAVTLRGTDGPNELSVIAKDALVLGLGGRDHLAVSRCGSVARGNGGSDVLESAYQGCAKDPIALYGGAGNDSLRGRSGPDILIGNAGHDKARGGKGRDRCQAEMEAACELN